MVPGAIKPTESEVLSAFIVAASEIQGKTHASLLAQSRILAKLNGTDAKDELDIIIGEVNVWTESYLIELWERLGGALSEKTKDIE